MKKKSIFYLLASSTLGIVLTLLCIGCNDNKVENNNTVIKQPEQSTNKTNKEVKAEDSGNYCDYNFHRLKGYKYIKPLLDGECECESPRFSSLKGELTSYIDNAVRGGILNCSSVYLKNLTTNEWMVINPDLGFRPGSLIKVAVLISYLRMAENNPGLLNTEITYVKDNTVYPIEEYQSDNIMIGNKYKIKDLLHYMVANSDNHATVVLENFMDMAVFKKTFSDLGLKELSFSDTSYRVSAKSYSNFFSVIYNAGYFSNASSEYAASLLTECTFRDGLMKYLPSTIKVAHKFGEWGNGINKELHETGIIYLNGNPYLLTVMTNGNKWDNLSDIIGTISKIVYDKMAIRS